VRSRSRLAAAIGCFAVVFGVGASNAFAAPVFSSASETTSSSSSQLTIAVPANVAAGDLMLAAVAVRVPAVTPIAAPSGWTLIRRDNNDPTSAALTQALYFKVVDRWEPASYTWTWRFSQPVAAGGAIVSYHGVDPLQPIDAHSGRFRSFTSQIVAPSVTTTASADRVVAFFAHTDTKATTSPSGTEERYNGATKGGKSGLRTKAADLLQPVAGASGDKIAVTSGGGSTSNIGQLVALSPSPESAPLTHPLNISPPTISGAAAEGGTLTANPGLWSSPEAVTYGYQWQRCDSAGAGCTNITGATAQSFQATTSDVGWRLRVVVTAMNSVGLGSAASATTDVISPKPSPPVNTTLPTVSGTAEQGQTLTAAAGSWTGLQPITYGYQWRRCDSSGGACGNVSGALASSYQASSSDVGFTLRVVVTATNAAGSAAAASNATQVVAAPLSPLPSSNTSYSSESPFNQPIPSSATVDRNSSTMVGGLVQAATSYGTLIAVKRYSVPVYYADATTARHDVRLTASWRAADWLLNVPIPDLAQPDQGGDGHMVVIDRSTGCEYDFFDAGKVNGAWESAWANAMPTSSNGLYPRGTSARGSGFGLLAGLIFPHELVKPDGSEGTINHALVFNSPYVKAGGPVLPATESDGRSTLAYAIPEGARVQLDPAFNVNSLTKPYERVIARALQRYGAYLGDVSGSTIDFYASNPDAYASNPYASIWGDQTYVGLPVTLISNLRVLTLGPQYTQTMEIVPNGCNTFR
jgi:hypothetical protein